MRRLIDAERLKNTVHDQDILSLNCEYNALNECIDEEPEIDAIDIPTLRKFLYIKSKQNTPFGNACKCVLDNIEGLTAKDMIQISKF